MTSKLERCHNWCCLLIDGRSVTKAEYEAAEHAHPGNYPGMGGFRNAPTETIIACRKSAATAQ